MGIVAVYYPGYHRSGSGTGNTSIANLNWSSFNTIIDFSVGFTSANNGTIGGTWLNNSGQSVGNSWTASAATALVNAAKAQGKKVILCIGSNSTSNSWNANLDTSQKRTTAATNLANLVATHGYDGVDLDGEPGNSITNYRSFWQAVVAEFTARGWRTPGSASYKTISLVCFGSETTLAKNANIDGLDWMAPMLYTPYENTSRHLSPISGAGAPWDSWVTTWNTAPNAIPRSKILPGMSYYVFTWPNASGPNVSGGSPTTDRDWSVVNTGIGGVHAPNATWYSTAKMHGMVVAGGWSSFESATSLEEKAAWIRSGNAGGTVVWHYQHGSLGGTSHPLAGQMASHFSDIIAGTEDPGTPPPTLSKFATFSDGFDGTSLDSAKWETIGSHSVSGGTLRLSAATGQRNGVQSSTQYDLVSSTVSIENAAMIPVGTQGGNQAEFYVQVDGSGTQYARFVKQGVNLFFQVSTNSGASHVHSASITFDGTAHRYWRFENTTGSTLLFRTSPDGTTWTTRSTYAVPFSLTALYMRLQTDQWTAENTEVWQIERVNTPSAPGTAPTAAPANLVGTPGNQQVSLSWNSVATATEYQRRFRQTGGIYGAWISIGSGLTNVVSGLVNGVSYDFQVRGANSGGAGPESTASGITPTAPAVTPKAEDFVEDFSQVSGNWTFGGISGFTAGQGVTPVTTSLNNWMRSAFPLNLTNSFFFIRAMPSATPSTRVTSFQAWVDDNNWVGITWTSAGMFAQQRVAGTTSTIGNIVAYSPTTMLHVRILHTGSVLQFAHSADAASWTTFASTSPPFAITAVHLRLHAYRTA